MKVLTAATLATLFALSSISNATTVPNENIPPKLIVIASHNFDGEVAIAMAKSVQHRAGWTVQVNHIVGEQPSSSKTGDRGSYPLFVVLNGNGDVVATHVGLANAHRMLEEAAEQLSH